MLWAEKAFRKAAWPVVAIIPNNMICLLAGATGMSWIGFAIVNISGTFVRVLGVRLIGDAFSDPILSFNEWIGRNRLVLTADHVRHHVLLRRAQHAARPDGSIETPDELAEELEASAEELDATDDATGLERGRIDDRQVTPIPPTGRDNRVMAKNVLGDELEPCGFDPLTGFYRDGCCTTGVETPACTSCARR